ncbi:hypothetical protein [Amycolatopsis cihanbeyliensis]|uniref:Uncharacterized protein n=1 Tax=Amycolatopsis cihanbeyliensis TaxID=1128664 RepID=A0A542DBN4_AMYCI|nr:hypothetical protein [Amycolatopsis cihanbeyliensis]TQJ00479.1 hypothetical protein FB471_0104 [Amycolatopsis cihanbeyliensis]
MNLETHALIRALEVVNNQVPYVARALVEERLDIAKEHEFAGLLTGLGELPHEHADGRARQQGTDTTDESPSPEPPAELPSSGNG